MAFAAPELEAVLNRTAGSVVAILGKVESVSLVAPYPLLATTDVGYSDMNGKEFPVVKASGDDITD